MRAGIFVVAGAARTPGAGALLGPRAADPAAERPALSAADPSPPPPREATAEELAIVAPLRSGERLEGWEVTGVQANPQGLVRVVLRREKLTVKLEVARGGGPIASPAPAGPYDVFYSAPPGNDDEAQRLSRALAAIVEKNRAPMPAAMPTFTPGARPSDLL